MQKVDKTLIGILMLLGVVHTALTPLFYDSFNEDAVWFAGTGISFIHLSFLNMARFTNPSLVIARLCVISNLLGCALIVCLFYVSDSVQAQGSVSALVLAGLVVFSSLHARKL